MIGLVLFLVASNTQTGWVYLLSGTIFGVLITGFLSSRHTLKPAGFRLWLPDGAPCGQGFWATMSWQHASSRYPVFWRPQGGLHLEQQGREQAMFEPQQREQRLWLVADRRGLYTEVPGELVCYGPLAWCAARRTLAPVLSQPLCVLPRRLKISSQQLKIWAAGPLKEVCRGQPSGQGDLRRLRDYQVGDDARWIHWPSSARSGELVVREFSQGGSSRLVLCWGCNPLVLEQPGAAEAFEWLLSWVYTFFEGARELGWQVELLCPRSGSQWQLSQMARELAAAEPLASEFPPAFEPHAGLVRLDFWLGQPAARPAVQTFEFHPRDYVEGVESEPVGIGPGQEPLG